MKFINRLITFIKTSQQKIHECDIVRVFSFMKTNRTFSEIKSFIKKSKQIKPSQKEPLIEYFKTIMISDDYLTDDVSDYVNELIDYLPLTEKEKAGVLYGFIKDNKNRLRYNKKRSRRIS